jgi:hypothetical protein
MELAFLAGDALDKQFCLFIYEYGHGFRSFPDPDKPEA